MHRNASKCIILKENFQSFSVEACPLPRPKLIDSGLLGLFCFKLVSCARLSLSHWAFESTLNSSIVYSIVSYRQRHCVRLGQQRIHSVTIHPSPPPLLHCLPSSPLPSFAPAGLRLSPQCGVHGCYTGQFLKCNTRFDAFRCTLATKLLIFTTQVLVLLHKY